MSPPGSNTPDRWWQWRWVGPALLVISAIVNLMNPHHTPGLRMVSWVMLPLTMIALGYTLYANYRERRRRHDASNRT
jgi:predicted permease